MHGGFFSSIILLLFTKKIYNQKGTLWHWVAFSLFVFNLLILRVSNIGYSSDYSFKFLDTTELLSSKNSNDQWNLKLIMTSHSLDENDYNWLYL